MAAISEREARLREIRDQAIKPGPESLQEKLEDLRTFAVSRLTRLRELLANPRAIHEARALLAEQVGKFTIKRTEENGTVGLKANGSIDFFGESALHAWVVPGEGIVPNVCPSDLRGWLLLREKVTGEEDSFGLGRRSASAEALGLYRMIGHGGNTVEELRALIALPPKVEAVLLVYAQTFPEETYLWTGL